MQDFQIPVNYISQEKVCLMNKGRAPFSGEASLTVLPIFILTKVVPSLTTLFLQLKFIIDYAD